MDGSSNIIFTTTSGGGSDPSLLRDSSLNQGPSGLDDFSSVNSGANAFSARSAADEILPPYSAYAPPGVVEGSLVYVNYAREKDFEQLKDLGVSVLDRIIIARYGKIHQSNKVANAQTYGARGLILYPDPEEVANGGQAMHSVYPNTWWLPATGVHRGSVLLSAGGGDPLTPGWASVNNAHRIDLAQASTLPNIPVQPISMLFEILSS